MFCSLPPLRILAGFGICLWFSYIRGPLFLKNIQLFLGLSDFELQKGLWSPVTSSTRWSRTRILSAIYVRRLTRARFYKAWCDLLLSTSHSSLALPIFFAGFSGFSLAQDSSLFSPLLHNHTALHFGPTLRLHDPSWETAWNVSPSRSRNVSWVRAGNGFPIEAGMLSPIYAWNGKLKLRREGFE